MDKRWKAAKAAFPHTLPIMAGFLFLGMAYGIYMQSKGFSFWWPIVISVVVYAGSMQFVAVDLLLSAFHPLYSLALTLMVNARHLFYGLSMLEKYHGTGKKKWYLIYGLTDETFSVNCSARPPEGVDEGWFLFFVTFLNQCYWLTGTALGALAGTFVTFNTTGIDFVMTALFVVIFLNQWQGQKRHTPAVVGVVSSVLCLLVFGRDNFILPAMALILAALTLLRKPLEKGEDAA